MGITMRHVSFKISMLLLVCLCLNLNAYGQINQKPPAAPAQWTGLLGEYILNGQIILLSEIDGKLHALSDNDLNLSLRETAANQFITDNNISLSFKRDNEAEAISLLYNDKIYQRNHIEPRDGNTFKVSLDKSIEDYTRAALNQKPPIEEGEFRPSDLVDVTNYIDNVKLDVRYATSNNFLGVATYSQAKTFLQRPAATAIAKANQKLNAMGYGLLMHDGYRPWYVTKIFWDATEGPERDFVADPSKGSKHNRGCAIDLTLYDLKTGQTVKMVGTYDEMSARSYPDYKGGTSLERWHRDLLRSAMEEVGFSVNSLEWWHFDYKDWQKYPILNEKFENISPTK